MTKCRSIRAIRCGRLLAHRPGQRIAEVFEAEADGRAVATDGTRTSHYFPRLRIPLEALFATLDQ
ncbi:MAG: hypothetical protein M0R74_09395 [Dehalococcoidia bacterium]|nr:hypothetical protein [Dehalococcoidia bacterium]